MCVCVCVRVCFIVSLCACIYSLWFERSCILCRCILSFVGYHHHHLSLSTPSSCLHIVHNRVTHHHLQIRAGMAYIYDGVNKCGYWVVLFKRGNDDGCWSFNICYMHRLISCLNAYHLHRIVCVSPLEQVRVLVVSIASQLHNQPKPWWCRVFEYNSLVHCGWTPI